MPLNSYQRSKTHWRLWNDKQKKCDKMRVFVQLIKYFFSVFQFTQAVKQIEKKKCLFLVFFKTVATTYYEKIISRLWSWLDVRWADNRQSRGFTDVFSALRVCKIESLLRNDANGALETFCKFSSYHKIDLIEFLPLFVSPSLNCYYSEGGK
jgi:hypothetical protein